MRISLGDGCTATVTGDPLRLAPRFDIGDFRIRVAPYADAAERGRFIAEAFGSRPWLWDTPDELWFDRTGRDLAAAEFQLPGVEAAAPEDTARLPATPPVRPGGLHADEAADCHLEVTSELLRAPGDTALTCLRDLDVLDAPLEARIGIAPNLALLVQEGEVVGWSLTDPARHVTTGFAAPSAEPPAPATRRAFTACLDILTTPVFDRVRAADPAALSALRALHHALRTQRDDRHRAEALLVFTGGLLEDHGGE
ncbi:hypothetical protein KUM39_23665 [Streptomyces sp. J2-1]|uniref:hypothetical protein n=1 Tax=Streptomyces corallincola TaxID=2851888 RepID=UPI001C384A66|nr:hypothetical protein [Streptomyces corallincola]MBV2357333.1 hypothetical protein [Streptomyces corallincola]